MNGLWFSLHGYYYDGRQPLRRSATLEVAVQDATLVCEEQSSCYRVSGLLVSPRVGRADRFIALPDGGQFQCADVPALDRLPQQNKTEGAVAWLERRAAAAVASVVLIVALLAGGYEYGLPAAAERVAAKIPLETEHALGEEVLGWLDDNQWFQPSGLDRETRDRTSWKFEALNAELAYARHYRLEFRQAEFVGANAFAMPGGTIVITDDMMNLAASDEEVMRPRSAWLSRVCLQCWPRPSIRVTSRARRMTLRSACCVSTTFHPRPSQA